MKTYDETIDFVLDHLRETAAGWRVTGWGGIRPLHTNYSCPVLSACGGIARLDAWSEGKKHGLEEIAIQQLVHAADNHAKMDNDIQAVTRIRDEMLDIIGEK